MKKIGMIADSYCGISQQEAEELGMKVIPMPFYCRDKCYYEGVSMNREEFFKFFNAGEKITTSQLSPETLMEAWREALTEHDEVLYFPLSSGLSGSCSTAMAFARDEEFEGKVFVVDHGRISTPLYCTILDAIELAGKGLGAEEIKGILEEEREQMSVYLAVETLEPLKRGGRITPAGAALGTLLNIKPVLSLGVGVLDVCRKVRSMKKARKTMLELIREDMDTKFSEFLKNGELKLLAATSADEETTKEWIEEIREAFPGMEVTCKDLTLGVASHVGEGALGVGCACHHAR